MKLARLERVRHKSKQQLLTAKDELVVFKKKLATEDKKLKISVALLKKQEEAEKIKLVEEQRKKEGLRVEQERIALELSKKKEEEQKQILLAEAQIEAERLRVLKQKEEAELLVQEEAKKAAAEKKRLALLKKKEEERLALLKKREDEDALQKYLDSFSSLTEVEEIEELEKLDLLESDNIGEEVALFNQDKKKSGSGFKPLGDWFKYSLGYSSMLKNFGTADSGREAIKGTIMINPHSYYFIGATTSFDINDYESPYYQPDFSYSFGYSDWHQDTFSWNYSNYANNKFMPSDDESRFNFQDGNWELSCKTKMEDVPFVDTIKWNAKAKYKPSSNSKKVSPKLNTPTQDKET